MATLMDREPEPLDIKVLLRMLNLKEHNAARRVPSWLCSKPEQGLVVRPMSCQQPCFTVIAAPAHGRVFLTRPCVFSVKARA